MSDAGEEHRDRGGRDRDHRVDENADDDLHRPENQSLPQDATVRRIYELWQKGEIHNGDLRFSRLVRKPMRNSLLGLSFWQILDLEWRPTAGAHRLPGEPQQVERADDADGVVSIGHRQHEGSNAECSAQHVKHEAQRHATKRDQPGGPPLTDGPRYEVDHVRSGVRTMPRAMAAKVSKLASSGICVLRIGRMPRRAANDPRASRWGSIFQRQLREALDDNENRRDL